jgi:hypothetical protein
MATCEWRYLSFPASAAIWERALRGVAMLLKWILQI